MATQHVTPPHQDNYYFCLVPANVVTIWLALDAVDAENGCLRYVDGSHRHGFRAHSKSQILGFSQGIRDYSHEDFSREVAVCLRPGDAVAHHGMTIHRADANLSATRQRRSKEHPAAAMKPLLLGTRPRRKRNIKQRASYQRASQSLKHSVSRSRGLIDLAIKQQLTTQRSSYS